MWILLYSLGGYNPPSHELRDLPSLETCKKAAFQLMFEGGNNNGSSTMPYYPPYAKCVSTKTGEAWQTTFKDEWIWKKVKL